MSRGEAAGTEIGSSEPVEHLNSTYTRREIARQSDGATQADGGLI